MFPKIRPKSKSIEVGRHLFRPDIFVPDLRLAIEFDGSYYHKNKLVEDRYKSKALKCAGYNIIRIRQKPLKRINKADIFSDHKFNLLKVVKTLLQAIEKSFVLTKRQKTKIGHYLKRQTAVNEHKAKRYIDGILMKNNPGGTQS